MTSNAPAAYTKLAHYLAELAALQDAVGILSWDRETLMPKNAANRRADQLALLETMAHDKAISKELGDLIADAAAISLQLDAAQQANVKEAQRLYRHETSVSSQLVAANSRAVSAGLVAWEDAKDGNDYARLAPALGEIIKVQRDIAAAKGQALGLAPYDALLDTYNAGNRIADIAPLFNDLEAFLKTLLPQVLARQQKEGALAPLDGPFATAEQEKLGRLIAARMGFDFTRGRLDVSAHPFCGGGIDDVRMTTRYRPDDFLPSLYGVIHETGHGLYEQNRPSKFADQPAGMAMGMAVHESQSLIMEMQAALSPEFLGYLSAEIGKAFPHLAAKSYTPDNIRRHVTQVQPSFIRVEADEVTYPLHVILRTRLEQQLIDGTLKAADLRDAWNENMQKLIGITPPDDRLGCLQDIHWPSGLFGYFPCYTMGAMMAAQLFKAATTADPAIRPALAQGDFKPLLTWLTANVHSQGRLHDMPVLLTRATGKPLDVAAFKQHLTQRYG